MPSKDEEALTFDVLLIKGSNLKAIYYYFTRPAAIYFRQASNNIRVTHC